jgi:hypothetical protein
LGSEGLRVTVTTGGAALEVVTMNESVHVQVSSFASRWCAHRLTVTVLTQMVIVV